MRIKTKTTGKKAKYGNGSGASWPIAHRWAAMGTLVAYSAVGSKIVNAAKAQDAQRPGQVNDSVSQTQGSQPVRRFDIPAGPLDAAVTALEPVTRDSGSLGPK